ncbi:hypothetical protein NUU61_000592 [Penicillium alfredii]|uniref:Potassium channel domain-containing protein n=1 Tax=Penicillium alfredii TaxID=1506179 RepID=A0A9W9G9Z7_9EURO|nr:uncharacterized protein NUU61_000592 [Penicillium alfredii]KAJ5114833.1 hypothetical protein NUU61_000592 [Penicillium alfredii]
MNDPGLDDAIAEEASVLDRPSGRQEDQGTAPTEDENQTRIDPQHPEAARWWLASTAYPLTAGTFGPMASAFNICSLVQSWRIEIRNDVAQDVSDPNWIIGINAASLGCAILSNLVLSLNMARRIRFEVAQPIIILGWYISSGLLIGLLAAFKVIMDRPENTGLLYTQGYFYAAFAAGLYFIISSLLVLTVYGAYRGHYSREYKLTNSQRTLMLHTIIFIIYLLGGAAVYSRIESWRFLDALYWADFTLLTIGIGNIVPITHLGRGLLFPYAVGGIVVLGLIISSIRKLMLEHGRQKMEDLLTARTRRFLVKEAFSNHRHLRRLVPHLGTDSPEAAGCSERERRKREFIMMRQVRQLATVQRKWLSLITSLVLWMALWLVGAAVFWGSEKHRHWTYFEALYFAYTTLLTIGYGDFFPISSLGKAFFVFWSLLAVPTITILISNIGDTLIRFIRDITIFIGEATILPGEQPFLGRAKDLLHVSWTDKWLQETTGEKTGSQDIPDNENNNGDSSQPQNGDTIEAEEHKKEESARQRGDIAAENIHHYHYLLFREVRKMMDYATSNLSKEFDYLEWEYYLALIAGRDKPPVSPSADGRDDDGTQGSGEAQVFRDWSWIDKNSPLLGQKSEVEWLLGALTEALERELRRASRAYHSPEASEDVDSTAQSSPQAD